MAASVARPGEYVIVNYRRAAVGQHGGGHISLGWRGQKGRYALNLNGSVATQSTTKWNAVASRAIDGNTGGAWGKGEVTLTENVPNSWLQVTFPGDRAVNQVVPGRTQPIN